MDTQLPFNGLSPAEAERLHCLAEDCAEVIQAANKVLRHGYTSCNPNDPTHFSNRLHLEKKMGHVRYSMQYLCECGDTNKERVHFHADAKRINIKPYYHHQNLET